jgi:hypothetical protein
VEEGRGGRERAESQRTGSKKHDVALRSISSLGTFKKHQPKPGLGTLLGQENNQGVQLRKYTWHIPFENRSGEWTFAVVEARFSRETSS